MESIDETMATGMFCPLKNRTCDVINCVAWHRDAFDNDETGLREFLGTGVCTIVYSLKMITDVLIDIEGNTRPT